MAIEIYRRPVGTGLTPEEMAMLEEAERLPQVYDDDCPKLTLSQLAEFRPVNGMAWDERERRLKTSGIMALAD
ncbi:MAG: hypothetical protein LBR23_03035 [Spirochaetaceae bacterium]|jgi:hypothetical protein|nr:hypothetical protein [Spirochaetaceae bacterium]